MFTGLVEGMGTVHGARPSDAGRRIEVDLGPLADGVRLGDSISLAGCCQTVSALAGSVAAFDTVPETLHLTTLGELAAGDRVNVERSLAVGDRLGGHFVTGHVDGTATLRERREGGAERLWRFDAPADLVRQMVPKGSIAVDGVSLTLAEVTPGGFAVALIPTTLAETTLRDLAVGGRVNIETDVLGKYVLRALGRLREGGGLSIEALGDAGFLD